MAHRRRLHAFPEAPGFRYVVFGTGVAVLAVLLAEIVPLPPAASTEPQRYGHQPGGCRWEVVSPAGILTGPSGNTARPGTGYSPHGVVLLLDQCRGMTWHLERVPGGFEWVRTRFRDKHSVSPGGSPAPGRP